ncbi:MULTISPECIES: ribonuclease HII [Microtetraspora]|uniref:Ribonuclease HII n=1 Tax=Microtetraspora glauca TaxID=1996 RepID=A0ABV3GD92_MICGL|nr:ribonuclease HII [Microtetraspora sp. AC03309]MCC5575009.1 ribonuclease HII [Microtetraspora sp. AC03309]
MTVAYRPRPSVVRRDSGLYGYERALARRGFTPVAGVDEAGRGACAGPLVVAAVILGREIEGLGDSKLLSPARRERLYDLITAKARAVSVVVIPPEEIDGRGLHRCNIAGMRRAVAGLGIDVGYVLIDGFPVPGLPAPSLAIWKGDQVAACVAAASIVAKVTRDRLMRSLDDVHPEYGFAVHKGYVTAAHRRALADHGPTPHHRFSFVTVTGTRTGLSVVVRRGLTGEDEEMRENGTEAGVV